MDTAKLDRLDSAGYEVLDALSHVKGPPQNSLASPHAFIATDGKTYWVKGKAQHGLTREMVGGRLAAAVGVGPMARVVRVPREALPPGGAADHLAGTHVGFEDIPGTVNAKELHLLGVTTLDPKNVSKADRALVVAFHSWTGMNDAQVLLNLHTGRIHTIDFGDAFSRLAADPSLVVVGLPGVDSKHGSDAASVALDRIEAVSDEQILKAVAKMPWGNAWGADAAASRAERIDIGERLAERRSKVREVMKAW